MKLAVIFPGIGYHKDKPLLYYAAKLAKQEGYDVMDVAFRDLPPKVMHDRANMERAAAMACEQAAEQLRGIDFGRYDRILFVGKSIGTIAAVRCAMELAPEANLLLYTPLAETFLPEMKRAIAFTGLVDPWVNHEKIVELCGERDVKLYSYEEANHSLETPDVLKNIDIMSDVMRVSAEFMESFVK